MVWALIAIPMALLIPWWPFGPPPLKNVDLPPEVASMLSNPVPLTIFLSLISLIIDPILCGLGGLIGVAIFNKKPAITQGREPRADSPLDILKRRYPAGEIDKAEYDAMKKTSANAVSRSANGSSPSTTD